MVEVEASALPVVVGVEGVMLLEDLVIFKVLILLRYGLKSRFPL